MFIPCLPYLAVEDRPEDVPEFFRSPPIWGEGCAMKMCAGVRFTNNTLPLRSAISPKISFSNHAPHCQQAWERGHNHKQWVISLLIPPGTLCTRCWGPWQAGWGNTITWWRLPGREASIKIYFHWHLLPSPLPLMGPLIQGRVRLRRCCRGCCAYIRHSCAVEVLSKGVPSSHVYWVRIPPSLAIMPFDQKWLQHMVTWSYLV